MWIICREEIKDAFYSLRIHVLVLVLGAGKGLRCTVWLSLDAAWGTSGKYSRGVKGENAPPNRLFSVFSSWEVLCIFPHNVKNMAIKPKTIEQSEWNWSIFTPTFAVVCFRNWSWWHGWLSPVVPNMPATWRYAMCQSSWKERGLKADQTYLGFWTQLWGQWL